LGTCETGGGVVLTGAGSATTGFSLGTTGSGGVGLVSATGVGSGVAGVKYSSLPPSVLGETVAPVLRKLKILTKKITKLKMKS
jgi:hypothetical protein